MPKPGTVKEITEAYLKAGGFGGLVHPFNECGCKLGDLFPCMADDTHQCRPGYEIKCTPRNCEHGGGCEWHITTRKPRKR